MNTIHVKITTTEGAVLQERQPMSTVNVSDLAHFSHVLKVGWMKKGYPYGSLVVEFFIYLTNFYQVFPSNKVD